MRIAGAGPDKRAALIDAAGAHYVEAGVMTSVPPYGIRVPMLLGGAHAARLQPVLAALLRQPQPPLGRLGTAIRDALDGFTINRLRYDDDGEVRIRAVTPDGETIRIRGDERGVITFANCCMPIPGDDIMGYHTTGRGMDRGADFGWVI